MAFYKVLKAGHFSEERFNQVGAIVEIDENAAKVAEERGFLQITTEKPRPAKKETPEKKAKEQMKNQKEAEKSEAKKPVKTKAKPKKKK